MNQFLDIINQVLLNGIGGLSFYEIIFFLLILLIAIITRSIIAKFIAKKIEIIVKKTINNSDDLVFYSYIGPFKLIPFIFIFIYLSLTIEDNGNFYKFISQINLTLASIFIFWILYGSINIFSKIFFRANGIFSKAILIWFTKGLKYIILILGSVAVLELWGIKIGPVIAGLGLFGVAVALGAQDLFKNLISGIMILLEKRFQIGDVISVPGHTEGTVKHIGFRSTLITKFDSTPITIPNYIFAEAPILNFSNRKNRRINWTIGLEYNSTLIKIKKFTDTITKYIQENEDFIVNDDYKSFVRLDKFNNSSIDILIYCFTSTNDWESFLIIKEKLAIKIKEEVEKIGLNFAFPSQSIYLENFPKKEKF